MGQGSLVVGLHFQSTLLSVSNLNLKSYIHVHLVAIFTKCLKINVSLSFLASQKEKKIKV